MENERRAALTKKGLRPAITDLPDTDYVDGVERRDALRKKGLRLPLPQCVFHLLSVFQNEEMP